MKRLWLILFIVLSGFLFATEKTFVREYTYKASDYDSKVTSRANALEQVKRLLLEEVSVYIQSEFEMRDWEEQIGDKIESGEFAEPFNNELKIDNGGYRLKIIGSTTKNSYLRYVHLNEQQAMTIIQMNEWLENQLKTRKNRYGTIKVFSRVFSKALRMARLKGKLHDLRKTFATRLYFLTGQEFTLCYALGHTDTIMTKQYTNLDKVELKRAFPDIVAMKDSNSGVKKPVRGHNQGDTELYSNFGFMHVT